MQVVPVDLCYSQPDHYRLCERDMCIPWRQKCPCKTHIEFQCSLGNCIPLGLKCDGFPQCMYGEDEKNCLIENKTEATEISTDALTENYDKVRSAKEDGLSLPVVVVIASVCVFVCVLMVFLLYIYLTRRQKNNTSRESQSATKPLRKSYITSDVEDTDATIQTKHTHTENTINLKKPQKSQYLPVNNQNDETEYQLNNHLIQYDIETENAIENDSRSEHRTGRKNLAINPGAEIYNMDRSNDSRVSGLGKYTFKPRLKYLKSKPYHEIDEKDRDKLYVINSYKHCSGKSLVPETLTFDKDPKKFSDSFATDLLCSSTPRQPIKHSVQNNVLNSLESIASHSDLEIN